MRIVDLSPGPSPMRGGESKALIPNLPRGGKGPIPPSRFGKGARGLGPMPTFQISLPGSDSSTFDVFGLWDSSSPPSRLGKGDGESGLVFHADLPADPTLAFGLLDARQTALKLSRQALPSAEQSLMADLRELSLVHAGGTSFAIGEGENAGARAILAAAIQHQGVGVSYGLFDNLKIDPFQLDEAANAVSSFAGQVQRVVAQLALVETSSGGQRLGITRTAWTGDVETWWSAAASRDQRLQHEQVLAQALATRQGWLRFLLMVTGGITRVAATLASGPFSPVAIWATWNYLGEVVKEFRALNAAK